MCSAPGRLCLIFALASIASLLFLSLRPPARVEGRLLSAADAPYTVFLPAVLKNAQPSNWTPIGLYGRVTDGGFPVSGVSVNLRALYGWNATTIAATVTNVEGYYSFTQVPSLYLGYRLDVLYENLSENPNHLAFWRTHYLDGYTQAMTAHMGSFDIGEVFLISPPYSETVDLPYTFQWTPRGAMSTDSYVLAVLDPINLFPYQSSTQLGYASSYELTYLPYSFQLYTSYAWNVEIYGPDGGQGESHYRPVAFSSYSNLAGAATRSNGRQQRDPYLPPPKPEPR